MRISIFGLGYVGTVSAACLSRSGNTIIGVDTNTLKVESICRGESPVVEPGVSELLQEGVRQGLLSATTDPYAAITATDVSLICVGTPSRNNGSLNLDQVFGVARQIGEGLRTKPTFHVVAIRSTVLPGTIERVAQIVSESSGKVPGKDFGVASNPEFLREGTAVADFERPPFTIVGTDDPRVREALRQAYDGVSAPFVAMEVRAAELLKYTCNVFHALKVAFANEIGTVSKKLGVDSHEVMKVFSQDTKLNISSYYLTPGFAFGGSCLPKDVRALTYQARLLDVETPLLGSLMDSNEQHIKRVVDWVVEQGKKRVGVLGLSFKSDTDDMRESPMVRVIETLLGKGYTVLIYDANVSLSRLIGANKRYIEQEIPHISSHLRSSVTEVVDASDLIIVGHRTEEFRCVEGLIKPHHLVLDLVRFTDNASSMKGVYEGICW